MPRDPLSSDKARLRTDLRRRRKALARAAPDAPRLAAEALPLDRLPPFSVVAGYAPLGGELDPGPVLARLTARGASLALPAAVARAAPLVFREATGGGAFAPDAFGIPAPSSRARVLTPDLVIAPVLAFDRRGGRLGQGAGCYDRTLAGLRAAGRVFVIGLAYAGQEVDQTPADDHDQPLDAILTEMGYSVVRKDI